jgi:hypothetical protein
MKKPKSKWDVQITCKHYRADFSGICMSKLQPEVFCVKSCKVFELKDKPKVSASNGM